MMEIFVYQPKGTCSTKMEFELEGDIIRSLKVTGGCSGNLQGICSILKNKQIDEVLDAFSGIRCGLKPTSCPDQIACALREYQKAHV